MRHDVTSTAAGATRTDTGEPRRLASIARHTLVVLALVALFVVVGALLWNAFTIVALTFVAILLSVLLATPAHYLHDRTGAPYWLSLLAVVITLLAVVLGFTWILGEQVVAQVQAFIEDAPTLLEEVEERLSTMPGGPWLLEQLDTIEPDNVLAGAQVIQGVTGMASAVFEGVLGLVFILFVGLFVAANPCRYRDGLVQLVPHRGQRRAREVLGYLTKTLQFWVLGQLAAMIIVGTLTTVGLLILGVPYAFLLGFVAGLLEFIPIIGPFIAFLPAALVALTVGTETLLWVVGLYFVIQQLESYVVLPLAQRKAVDLPPALIILVVLVGSQVLGILGMFIAVPVTAMIVVLVKALYIHDVQHDPVSLPGGVEER